MMMKFIPVYKCAMCAETVEYKFKKNNVYEVEENEIAASLMAVLEGDLFVNGKMIPKSTPHFCKDGSCGVCNLIGFRKLS